MSIKTQAMKVKVSIHRPQMTAKDLKATVDAERANNAHNAGEYRKRLYPKHLTAPIDTLESSVRAYVTRMTYRYGDADILINKRFMLFAEAMAQYELQFNQAVTAFLNNWANVMHEAQAAQGDMFEADRYPDMAELKSLFSFRVRYNPVTDYDDWAAELNEDELEIVRQNTERDTLEAMDDLMREPLTRLRKVVERLASVCDKEDRVVVNKRTNRDEVKPPIFRNSVVDNIVDEIAMLMDYSDILPDSVTDIAREVMDNTPDVEALRNNNEVREETGAKAKALLSSIDSMLFD